MYKLTNQDMVEAQAMGADFIMKCCLTPESLYMDPDEVEYIVEDWEGYFSEGVIAYGASKIVLIPYNKNFVIKIPILGSLYPCYDEDDNLIEGKFDHEPYECEYCSKEAEVYKKAEEAELSFLFAECRQIGACHQIPIYIQTKVDNIGIGRTASHQSREQAVALRAETAGENYLYLGALGHIIDAYGLEIASRALRFINKHRLGDWHDGNFGFINDKIIFSDYSGFDS